MVTYNDVDYFYVYNLQGDVVALIDANGTQMVEYGYDAWGNPISKTGTLAATLGTLNPFRYRGYVYDEETGLYYLRSRYYNPEWKRFINADKYISQGSLFANMFAYCKNAPLMFNDPDGKLGVLGVLSAVAIGKSIVYLKEIVSAAADIFLTSKGWTLTNTLFQHGLYGNGTAITDKTDDVEMLDKANEIKRIIAAAPETYKMIEPVLASMMPGTTATTGEGKAFEYMSGDMYYSLQHVNYTATVTMNEDKSWNAVIHITDKYDFDAFRSGLSLGPIANNGGLVLQMINVMTEYNIDLTIEMTSK